MKRQLRLGSAALIAAWAACAPGLALADVLDDRLKSLGSESVFRSWSPIETYKGSLDEDKSSTVKVSLPRGEYLIMGICDDDCFDLDIEVNHGDGGKLAEDFEDDDVPLVTLKLAEASEITIRVDMAFCEAGPCAYAVRTFSR